MKNEKICMVFFLKIQRFETAQSMGIVISEISNNHMQKF